MRDSAKQKKGSESGATTRPVASPQNPRVVSGVICVVLAVLVWIVFGQTLKHDFINYDDGDYVNANPRIMNGVTLAGIGWAFTHVHSANWHPLTTISHMLDCQLYGLQAWGHHLTNVLLHTAATIFCFMALWELTRARWPSAFVAAVFAIHPLHVESVAWIAERKDVLSGLFFMLTLWAYARYVRGSSPSSGRYASAIVFFGLGLMCKPTLVTTPFVLLLLDYWPLRRFGLPSQTDAADSQDDDVPSAGLLPVKRFRDLLIEKIPFFALSAASCLATVLAQGKAVATIRQFTFEARITNAMVSYVSYVAQMFWPVRLSLFYPYPEGGIAMTQVLAAALGLAIVSVVFFIWRSRSPFLWTGWLWFLGMLIPMIGLVQVGSQARADRYTYLAQVGLYILVTWSVLELLSNWRSGGRRALAVLAVLIVTALTASSYVQTSFWRNSETIWRESLANTYNNYAAHSNLGNALMAQERLDEAVVQFQQALAIYPDYPDAINNLGSALLKREQLDEAVVQFRRVLVLDADHLAANNNLGNALMKKGQLDEAALLFRKAIAIDPDCSEAHTNLGYVLASKGNYSDAIASYRAAVRIRSNYAIAHNNLAVSLTSVGNKDEAIEQFNEALRLDGSYQDAHCNVASLLLGIGRRDEAIAHLREALRLKPDDQQVQAQLRQLGVEK